MTSAPLFAIRLMGDDRRPIKQLINQSIHLSLHPSPNQQERKRDKRKKAEQGRRSQPSAVPRDLTHSSSKSGACFQKHPYNLRLPIPRIFQRFVKSGCGPLLGCFLRLCTFAFVFHSVWIEVRIRSGHQKQTDRLLIPGSDRSHQRLSSVLRWLSGGKGRREEEKKGGLTHHLNLISLLFHDKERRQQTDVVGLRECEASSDEKVSCGVVLPRHCKMQKTQAILSQR